MRLLVLCPDCIPDCPELISSFVSCTNYFIPKSLSKFCDCDIKAIPLANNRNFSEIKNFFYTQNLDDYDAILALGLRYFSFIPNEYKRTIRAKYNGLICQIYDGARAKDDAIDITFTMKNDHQAVLRKHWHKLKKGRNIHIGWGADPELNYPQQDRDDLRILIDHPNYATNNKIDRTTDILNDVKHLFNSELWKNEYKKISVKILSHGSPTEYDFNGFCNVEYIPQNIPYSSICKEYNKAHIFMVTHPESLGLVALETAMSGALVISPENFISKDRLDTIRHYTYKDRINWKLILNMIDTNASRIKALSNTWDNLAINILDAIKKEIF